MTPEQQTPASVVERLRAAEPVYNRGPDYEPFMVEPGPLRLEAAAMIERLSAEREVMRAEIERADEVLGRAGPFYAASIEGARKIIRAALTQGESRQTGATWQKPEIEQDEGEICVRAFTSDNARTVSFSIRRDKVIECDCATGREGVVNVYPHDVFALPAAPTPAKGGERE